MPGAALEMRQVTACGEKETWRICPARLKVSMLVAWFDTASLYREKKYQGLLFLSPGRRLYLLQINIMLSYIRCKYIYGCCITINIAYLILFNEGYIFLT
jgi:hypothetical protein